MTVKSLLNGQKELEEKQLEKALRPQSFEEFPGQDRVKKQLKIFVSATLKRKEPLDQRGFSCSSYKFKTRKCFFYR